MYLQIWCSCCDRSQDKIKNKNNSNSNTIPSDKTYLDDSFSGEHVGFDLGQEHEAEVEGDVRLGSVQLQLFHGSAQQPFDAIVITVRLSGLDVIQQNSWGYYGSKMYR